jgi:hypothetical protein
MDTTVRNELIKQMHVDGHTMKEIIDATGASKSVISYHRKGVPVRNTKRLERRLSQVKKSHLKNLERANVASQERWENLRNDLEEKARDEWKSRRLDPAFLGFLGLYWGEGNKAGYIGIVNNDPGVIKIAIDWFLKLCPTAKLKLKVRCNPDQNRMRARNFWSSALQRPVETVPKNWLGKKLVKSRAPYGLCTVSFSDWTTQVKILTWIDCWRHEAGVPKNA